MLRLLALALVASGALVPVHASAQVQSGFAYCTVTDASSAQRTIWATPVFALEYGADDIGGIERGNQVAGEFLAHVASTLGGSGEKTCMVLPDRAGVEELREGERSTWSQRMYFIKLGDWRDVAWRPAPWSPPAATAASATVTGYFHCSAVQVDIPDRSDLSRTVATGVFPMQVHGTGTKMAMYEQAAAYATQFHAVVQANGVPVKPDCTGYDTLAEAQYAHQQTLRYNKGFNMKYTEVAWAPDAPAAAPADPPAPTSAPARPAGGMKPGALGVKIGPVGAELAQGLGRPSTEGAWVVEVLEGGAAQAAGIQPMDVLLEIAGQAVSAPTDVAPIIGRLRPGFQAPVLVWRDRRVQTMTVAIPAMAIEAAAATAPPTPATSATAPASVPAATISPAEPAGYYCFAFVTRSEPPLVVQTPVHKEADSRPTDASLIASLGAVTQAVQVAHPGKWNDGLARPTCYDNSGVFAGETFCVASTYKHFRGSQMAGLFCNSSRETLDKRLEDHRKGSGPAVQTFDWP